MILEEENMVVTGVPKTFYSYFDCPKDDHENLKHVTEFIIKRNESLVENKIKNELEQFFLKYKNDIHERWK